LTEKQKKVNLNINRQIKKKGNMKKLLTNSKINVARNLGFTLLFIAPVVMATSCKEKETPCTDYTNPDCENYDPERVRMDSLRADSVEYADLIKQLTGPDLDLVAEQNANLKTLFWGLAVRGPAYPETFADSVAGTTQYAGYVSAANEMINTSGVENYPDAITLYGKIKDASGAYLENPLVSSKLSQW